MADDTTRGVHLDEKQLVFTLMAAIVVCGVVFLFGVLVGRGVLNQRNGGADGALLTAPQVVPDSPPVSDPGPLKPGATATDDFSYPKRLSQPETPAEPLKAKPAADPPAAGSTPADMPQPAAEAPADSAQASEPEVATPGAAFTVQVAAVKKRGDADVVVKRLKAKGYDARVVAPEAGDRTGVFRVKVGSFKTRREADEVARKIETEGQYKPWVTR
ncbi:MAG: SPOR domain-containing protein [Acidobacteriota bacterium]